MKKILLSLLLFVGFSWSGITYTINEHTIYFVQGKASGQSKQIKDIIPTVGYQIDSLRFNIQSQYKALFETQPHTNLGVSVATGNVKLDFSAKPYNWASTVDADPNNGYSAFFVPFTIYESTGGGNNIASVADSFEVTIWGENQAPSFTLLHDTLTLDEDSSVDSLWVNSLIAGPIDEQHPDSALYQTVALENTLSNSSLFVTGPSWVATGQNANVSFNLKPNSNGVSWVYVKARDDAAYAIIASGVVNVDTSIIDSFLVIVTPQPDAPTSSDTTISIGQGQTHKIAIADLPFVDVDGDAVSNGFVTKNISNGSNSCSGSCSGTDSLEITMNKDFEGTDTLKFYLKDNSASTLSSSTHNLIVNITPNQSPSITSTPILKATLGKAYSYALVYADQDAISLHALQVSATGLPLGLSLSGSTVSGTPTVSGTFAVSVKVNDGIDTTTQNYSLKVNAAPAFTSTPVLDAKVGEAYSYSVTFSDDAINDGGVILSAGALPAGLSFAASKIKGTPTASGVFPVVLTLHDGIDTVKQEFSISIHGTVTFTSTAVVVAEKNKDYLYEVTFTGDGVGTYALSATGLPAGLSVSGTSISGKATVVGDFAIVLKLSDGVDSVTQNYSLKVNKESTTSLEQSVAVVADGFWLQAGSAQVLTLKGEILQEFHKQGFVPFASLKLNSGLYWLQSELGVQKVLIP